MADQAPKEKKTRVRKTKSATFTDQAKKLNLTELIAHYKAIKLEIETRQQEISKQLELVNSI